MRNLLYLNDCLGINKPSKFMFATPPPFNPNTENQTVDFGGATWKGQPGGSWTLQRENPEATNYSGTPGKSDINPATGKAYAINPATGVWDDNYYSTTVEPQMTGGVPSGGGTSGGGTGIPGGVAFNQPTIDLPKLYEGLYKSSGISDIERGLSDKTMAYNAAVGKIKDNPYLSEATMTGRISKLTDKFNADQANIKNDISMRKADIETKLNLQTKQFDINSEQAKLAWDQFNSLLSSGALDNASGQDIANITRATGLSSSMIQSAIGVSRAKNAPKAEKVNTQVIQVDDGTNVSAVVINQDTGEVINKQVIGASTPTADEVKAGLETTGGGTTSDDKQIADDKKKAPSQATQDAKNRMTLGTMMALYLQYGMTKQQIYNIYVNNTPYKQTDATRKADKARYGVK